jgi:uncharacterized protein (DUF169 family)
VTLASELVRLLDLEHPPVAVAFHEQEPGAQSRTRPVPEPAGCCFWQQAEQHRLRTTAADHAHCSVGSYTHGFISLEEAASGEDTAALVGSGWVTEADLVNAPRVAATPAAITYEPLDEAEDPDVVLVRLKAGSLMALQGAFPELSLVTKPQCQIVPLALEGTIAVSPGCAVSRIRTGLPADELTCALPARDLADIVAGLARSRAADAAVSVYADNDIHENFTPA